MIRPALRAVQIGFPTGTAVFPGGEKTTAASRGDGEAAVVVMGRVTLARLLGQGF